MQEPTAPRKMILLDPELDVNPRPGGQSPIRRSAGSRLESKAVVPGRSALPWAERLPTPRTLDRFLAKAQAAVRLRGQVTALLTTDEAIRDLNRRFRHKNKPTDVLSFPATNPAPSREKIAGDLAISVPTARRQAAEQGHALTCELEVLILHGLLHLAGYDHESDAGQMHRRERDLREKLGLPQGLIERASTPALSQRARKDGERASASRRETRKVAPDGGRRGTRRKQSGESKPFLRKPRRAGEISSATAARSRAK